MSALSHSGGVECRVLFMPALSHSGGVEYRVLFMSALSHSGGVGYLFILVLPCLPIVHSPSPLQLQGI